MLRFFLFKKATVITLILLLLLLLLLFNVRLTTSQNGQALRSNTYNLFSAVAQFLSNTVCDRCRYHGQFIAVARRRYLSATEQHRRSIHSTLAHYYLGTWSRGRRKPFRYSKKQLRCVSGTGKSRGKPRKLEDDADRLVTPQ